MVRPGLLGLVCMGLVSTKPSDGDCFVIVTKQPPTKAVHRLYRLANLRVGQLLQIIGNGACFGSINDNIYETGENGAKISSISHSNGPILVGQLRESQAKWVRVGKPDRLLRIWHVWV